MKIFPLAVVLLALGACRYTAPPRGPSPAPDVGWTGSRPITDVHRATFRFNGGEVWISNDFEGGRVSDAWQESDSVFVVHIRPENTPINDSPWYAFKAWSREPRTIEVRLSYRRCPASVLAGGSPIRGGVDDPGLRIRPSRCVTNEATLRLRVGPDTLWVAGQEMMTSTFFHRWTDSLAQQSHITRREIGRSARGRPLHMVEFGDPGATRHVMIIGRQHPPEATGTMALLGFVEELASSTPLAREFREHFRVHVVPLVNPDGLDLGHWRHNAGGVDLNRDWEAFNQPETMAVRNAFMAILGNSGGRVWFGVDFHSTQEDVFYTLDRTLETNPPDITDRWLDFIATRLPDYEVNDSPSGLETPMSRNWFYRAFGAPALIYEVGDQTDRELIRLVATTAAQGTMQILLEEISDPSLGPERHPSHSR